MSHSSNIDCIFSVGRTQIKIQFSVGFDNPNFLLSIQWAEQIHEGLLIPKGLQLNFSFRSFKHFQQVTVKSFGCHKALEPFT